jgi:hypothetical protein
VIIRYGSQWLPRVPVALGEGTVALGEAFPECNTRGRGSGEAAHGEQAFPRVPHIAHSGKRCSRSLCRFSVLPLPREFSYPLGEEFFLFKKNPRRRRTARCTPPHRHRRRSRTSTRSTTTTAQRTESPPPHDTTSRTTRGRHHNTTRR